ncbi:glycosyltransferase [Marivirga salinae]|uniref:Glycosyltransferase n=1 Tax=Marivirga salinarum TaxID=3059078 RepID=A0AA51RE24_9BACT|nr:glycosyltransferase [Marivirga sp. BDSF4-3]WMN10815.1 glycosyltransferase [Marivirga sp. BDSF4-3]
MSAKVSVICLCFNHEKYVEEAMNSVLAQTYPTELIVVDDASSDNSVRKINDYVKQHSNINIQTLFFEKNVGNCKAFNSALELTNADYIIDLAADDILLPDRVEEGVKNMELNPKLAINFTNANYIDEEGEYMKSHYSINKKGNATVHVPHGNLFHHILARYFICSPTMMYRASFFKEIGGYDENLAYEDFDLMLRLSRKYPFSYTDRILVEKRVLNASMSTKQYKRGSNQLESTLKICKKAAEMIQDKIEKRALLKRIAYEAKQAFVYKRFLIFIAFIKLGVKIILQK